MARTRDQLTDLENWFLDHPLQSNEDLVPGYTVFYTNGEIHMFPTNDRSLLKSMQWDWKRTWLSNVIVTLSKNIHMEMKKRATQSRNEEQEQDDGSAPWDQFDWSI